jgi:glycerol-3-phosphate dehydrogenase (NAD(P)+)
MPTPTSPNASEPLPRTISVLGGGSFGTALANIIAHNGFDTWLWMRSEQQVADCLAQRENRKYLPGYSLEPALHISADLAATVARADVLVVAIPSHSFRAVVKAMAPQVRPDCMVISTTKGLEGEGFTLMSEILRQELRDTRIGVLSGPNFAKEIIQNQYTASVIASPHAEIRQQIPAIFSSKTFRVYSNSDMYGVELGGALKNIYAIITGMAAALGCGQNTSAMLLTRALAEMGRFAHKLGANAMTFLGLAGMGDLILTCTSDLSRNYRVGYAVGQGADLETAIASIGGQVAEGINTLKVVKEKADALGVYMPLASGLHAILFEQHDISRVVNALMTGVATTDVEYQN